MTINQKSAATTPQTPIKIGLLSSFPQDDTEYLQGQLSLDPRFEIESLQAENVDIEILQQYTMLFILGADFADKVQDLFVLHLSTGGKLVWFMGPQILKEERLLKNLGLITMDTQPFLAPEPAVFSTDKTEHPLIGGIEWSSAPELKGTINIQSESIEHTILLRDHNSNTGILFDFAIGAGKLTLFTGIYQKEYNWNFQLWSYTGYFLYRILCYHADMIPESYAAWDYSPLPHYRHRVFFAIVSALACFATIIFYNYAKRNSKDPIAVNNHLYAKDNSTTDNKEKQPNPSIISTDATENRPPIENNEWENIGLHRQLSQFFMSFIVFLLISLPHMFLTLAVYSKYIQPFPMISGGISWLSGIFGAIFMILDLELATAMKKFFAEYRVQSPAKALKYAQIYVWFHLWLGVAQLGVFVVLGLVFMTTSYVAYLTFFLILLSINRLPNFMGVVGLMFDSLQRFDVRVKLNAILGTIINTLIQYLVIFLFRNWFKGQYQYGEAFGAAVGIIVGGLICAILDFMVFAYVFTRLGYKLGNLFRVDFRRENVRESFAFGFKLTLGNAWRGVAQIIEMMLISLFVLNYNSEMGYYGLVGHITSILAVLSGFLGALMPAISEAHGNKKFKLTEYYLVQGLRWSNFFVFFFAAVMFATARSFLMLPGPQWYGALKYIQIQIFFALWWPLAWWADTVFQGTNHSGYNTIVWIIEQGTRIILLIILLPKYQFWGIFYAYIPGIIAKGLVSIVLVKKKISNFRPYWMITTIIPFAGALLLYVILWGLNRMAQTWPPGLQTLTLVIALVGGFILYGFFTASLGGWDTNSIHEMERGLMMTKSSRLFFRPMLNAINFGHRVCPWREKFQIELYVEAMDEALTLTSEKLKNQNKKISNL